MGMGMGVGGGGPGFVFPRLPLPSDRELLSADELDSRDTNIQSYGLDGLSMDLKESLLGDFRTMGVIYEEGEDDLDEDDEDEDEDGEGDDEEGDGYREDGENGSDEAGSSMDEVAVSGGSTEAALAPSEPKEASIDIFPSPSVSTSDELSVSVQ
jgi:hypothetical protein